MSVLHLTKEDFDLVTGEGKSLVDFWASWCRRQLHGLRRNMRAR